VDTSDRLIGRRSDLFRASHARLLSSLSANTECQRKSNETAGGVSVIDYYNEFGGAVVAAPQ
jgi:hypothetical protein